MTFPDGKMLILFPARRSHESLLPVTGLTQLQDERPLVGYVIDISKCIGCGNCVRAARPRTMCRRLLPHVGRTLPRR